MSPDDSDVSLPHGFSVLLINIRSIKDPIKRALLQTQQEEHKPTLLALNETWLDDSIPNLHIPGYVVVSRRDRPVQHGISQHNYGGIALYRREFTISVTPLEVTTDAERSWHTVHTEIGPILLGVWYRPPGSSQLLTETLADELTSLSPDHVNTVLVGDLNLHHKKWLVHSLCNTTQGQICQDVCKSFNLRQLVRQPTREKNLLDLYLTDAPHLTTVNCLPAIADHAGVLAEVHITVTHEAPLSRVVWDFSKANWTQLNNAFFRVDCPAFFLDGNALDATAVTAKLTQSILTTAKQHIPQRVIQERKSTHPWINQRCLDAVKAIQDQAGTSTATSAAEQCSKTLKEEHARYIQSIRTRIGCSRGVPRHGGNSIVSCWTIPVPNLAYQTCAMRASRGCILSRIRPTCLRAPFPQSLCFQML